MSKSYGMAGWRLGFVLGNAEIVERIDLLQDHARAGIFVAGAGGGNRGAERPAGVGRRAARRLPAPAGPRARCPGGNARAPLRSARGSFYVWIQLPEGVTLEQLLEEHRVAVAPGEGFGATGAGWARLSLAVTDEQLELGLERLSRALSA